ncbi:hypothetical protein GCM10025865_21730 [Paraoerskovia sediminicola]|uniref:Spore protein YkvP/CgeB glycosyl transferase-like domain-containing protein n=1 Tax=Paraoerskovia sediminicola TaxID=1138587 RepID=A0ABM8G458_9CELL|nr:glycosyltransferase [Paraoerskovia sediminicola]BDZ42874.1 hypothetical protein GCM10025865_21730 [Paraoerskovia sediminicola]
MFAGTYYSKYPERMNNLAQIVEGASTVLPVEIFDRQYGTMNERNIFVPPLKDHVVGTLSAQDMERVYRHYRYAVTINTVKDSGTMFARRAFELLASGTVTVSNVCRGLRNAFGDLVPMSDDAAETAETVRRLHSTSDGDRYKAAALRKVLREHTYADRLRYILSRVSGVPLPRRVPQITVVIEVADPAVVERAASLVGSQQGVDVALVLACHADVDIDVASFPALVGARVVRLGPGAGDEPALVDGSSGLAVMRAGDWYGPHYLEGLALAWRYAPDDVVGKARRFVGGGGRVRLEGADDGEYARVPGEALTMASSLVPAALLNGVSVARVLDMADVSEIASSGVSIDRFDYCSDHEGDVDVAMSSELSIDLGLSADDFHALPASDRARTAAEGEWWVRDLALGSSELVEGVSVERAMRGAHVVSELDPQEEAMVWSRSELPLKLADGRMVDGVRVDGTGSEIVTPVIERGETSSRWGLRVRGPGNADIHRVWLVAS